MDKDIIPLMLVTIGMIFIVHIGRIILARSKGLVDFITYFLLSIIAVLLISSLYIQTGYFLDAIAAQYGGWFKETFLNIDLFG